MLALGRLGSRLDESQINRLRERARSLLNDEDHRIREESMITLSAEVRELLDQAQQAILQGELDRAEAILLQAIESSPGMRARLRLGRFYYDNGQADRGLSLLREYGIAPGCPPAPRSAPPRWDAVWRNAAVTGQFYSFSNQHDAALPSHQLTRVRIGYTREALYLGYYCEDEHPDSLVVGSSNAHWGEVWWDDDVELYFDVDFDHRTYCQIGMNSVGTVNSGCFDGGLGNPIEWTAGDVATHVSDDSWSAVSTAPWVRGHSRTTCRRHLGLQPHTSVSRL